MIRLHSLPVAIAMSCVVASAAAVPQVNVDSRESVTHVTYGGGFAIAYDSGEDGSLIPVADMPPAPQALDGAHTFNGAYLYWTVTYTVNWHMAQSFAVDAAAHVLSGQGSLFVDETSAVWGPNCQPCAATVSISGKNAQTVGFTLDASTAYQFHSDSTNGQFSELDLFDVAAQRWFGLWSGPIDNQGRAFDRSGTLQPGTYRLRNNVDYLTADSSPQQWDTQWSYMLTLPDAQISVVPEPAPGLMLLGGLGLLAGRRRRRRRP
jgi:hypothetical protein